jgi:hypothetical protein
MIPTHRFVSLPCVLFLAAAAFGQNAPPTPATSPGNSDKAASYYNYSLGHLYAELAAASGNRGDYFNKSNPAGCVKR